MSDDFIVNELTADERRWTTKATELETEALPTLRASAEKWATAITGGLGVVGLAAILKGPEAFSGLDPAKKLGGPDIIAGIGQKALAEGLFLFAAVVALIATGLATAAAQSTVQTIQQHSGQDYRSWATTQVNRWKVALTWSRWLAAIAVGSVLASASFVWFGEPKPSTPTVIDGRGSALCPSSAGANTPAAGATYAIRCGP